jgi:histidinol dehydrogenase
LVGAFVLSLAVLGPFSLFLVVCRWAGLLVAGGYYFERLCAALPRAAIAREALAHSRLIEVDSLEQAIEVSNRYAPEHLILQVARPRAWLARVDSAGSVFLGAWTPESVGDYASGSNHVLPTYGYARSHSGVSVASFQKQVSVQELTPAGLRAIGPCTATLAAAEQLEAHRRAVTLRLAALDERAEVPAA